MNFFEQQMRQMFGNTDIIQEPKFVGKTVLGKLDDELRAKLQFISTVISGQYNAVQASVISRTEGVVDKQTFKFSDIIGMQKRRNLGEIEPHIWEYDNKPEWYIPITGSQKEQIADTVLDYVGMYQDRDMAMKNQPDTRPTVRLKDLLLLGLPQANVYLLHKAVDVGFIPASGLVELNDQGRKKHAALLDARVECIRQGAYGVELVLDEVDAQALADFDTAMADAVDEPSMTL